MNIISKAVALSFTAAGCYALQILQEQERLEMSIRTCCANEEHFKTVVEQYGITQHTLDLLQAGKI